MDCFLMSFFIGFYRLLSSMSSSSFTLSISLYLILSPLVPWKRRDKIIEEIINQLMIAAVVQVFNEEPTEAEVIEDKEDKYMMMKPL